MRRNRYLAVMLVFFVWSLFFLVWFCIGGHRGENKYGIKPPKCFVCSAFGMLDSGRTAFTYPFFVIRFVAFV